MCNNDRGSRGYPARGRVPRTFLAIRERLNGVQASGRHRGDALPQVMEEGEHGQNLIIHHCEFGGFIGVISHCTATMASRLVRELRGRQCFSRRTRGLFGHANRHDVSRRSCCTLPRAGSRDEAAAAARIVEGASAATGAGRIQPVLLRGPPDR